MRAREVALLPREGLAWVESEMAQLERSLALRDVVASPDIR